MKSKIFDIKLDDDEKELLESVENDKWETISDFKEEASFAKKAASNYLRKDAGVIYSRIDIK